MSDPALRIEYAETDDKIEHVGGGYLIYHSNGDVSGIEYLVHPISPTGSGWEVVSSRRTDVPWPELGCSVTLWRRLMLEAGDLEEGRNHAR